MNFLFLFPDEMSASSLGCYGNPYVKTPNLDRVAQEGTRFENCYVQNPVCSPSRCSLMTGTYVHNRGHRTLWHLLRQDEPSLLRYMKNNGYDIKWYGKNDVYSDAYLSEICDDADAKRAGTEPEPTLQYRNVRGSENAFETEEEGGQTFLFKSPSQESDEIPIDVHVGRAIDYLKGRKKEDKPFFMYLPLELPHPPYSICEPFYSMYDPKEVGKSLTASVEGKPSYEELIRKYRHLDKIPQEVLDKVYAVYLGMVSYVDYLMGKLDETLEACDLKEDTVVIIASDHGDWHGMRRLVEKWPNAMDDEIVHVPLIIRMPGGKKAHVVEEQNELFDIMATVMDLANIEAEHTHFAHSLVSQLKGAVGDPNRAVYCEGGYDTHEPKCFEGDPGRRKLIYAKPEHSYKGKLINIYSPKHQIQQEHPEAVCRTAMIRTLDYKLVRRTSGENELYYLKEDKEEAKNLYFDEAYANKRIELELRMLDWYQRTSDTVPYDEDFRFFGR